MSGYKDLVVWQKSITLAKQVYLDTGTFPRSQQYSLTQQMQRAAVSITSNIAEGHNRNSTKEYIHFLGISLGSAAELETQYILSSELGFLKNEQIKDTLLLINEIGRMLRGIIKTLQNKTAA